MHPAAPALAALLSTALASFGGPSPNLIRVSDMSPRFELTRFPLKGSMPADLSDDRSTFQNILLIDRDYGPAPEDIAVDAWVSKDGAKLEEVRMWWVRHDNAQRRAPFSRRVLKRLRLGYKPISKQQWYLGFAGDNKQFVFSVEMHGNKPAVYGEVDTDQGIVSHCRVTKAKLHARRVLGVPTGLSRMAVTCIDDRGKKHRGNASWRKV